jgi:hypothetical protein
LIGDGSKIFVIGLEYEALIRAGKTEMIIPRQAA